MYLQLDTLNSKYRVCFNKP